MKEGELAPASESASALRSLYPHGASAMQAPQAMRRRWRRRWQQQQQQQQQQMMMLMSS
jgi:hypothetical protein